MLRRLLKCCKTFLFTNPFCYALSQFGIFIFVAVESTSSPAALFLLKNVSPKPPKTPVFIGYLLDTLLHSSQNTACFTLIEAERRVVHSVSSSRGKN